MKQLLSGRWALARRKSACRYLDSRNQSQPPFFAEHVNSFSNRHLGQENCFLCGEELTKKTRSKEHVIPTWLQNDLDLWGHRLNLLNKSSIPYRQLTIPCCSACNNECLADLESDVQELLLGPYRSPTPEEEHLLFQWCSKILFGLLRKEHALVIDRTGAIEGPIVPSEFLEGLSTFHHFMTSIRRPFSFVDFKPYSLFTLECYEWSDSDLNFDYYDFVTIGEPGEAKLSLTLAIRVKRFGLICVFQDNGFQKEYFQKEFDAFQGIWAHPIQFLEFACKSAYKHSLISFSPRYSSVAADEADSEVTVMRVNSPRADIWNEWDKAVYERLFMSIAERSGFTDILPDHLYEGDLHHTWLFEPNGEPIRMISPVQ